MRVLHVVSSLSRDAGGISSVVIGLANIQVAQGCDVAICTTDRGHPATSVLPASALRQSLFDSVRLFSFSVDFTPLLISMPMRHWLQGNIENFDIVHIHGLYRFPVTYAATLARKRSVPYVVTPHGSLDPYLYRQSSKSVFLKRLYEKFFDWPNLNDRGAIHYTSLDEQRLSSFLGFSARSFVVPNGLAWREYENLPPRGEFRKSLDANDAPVVLFLGRINFKKGFDILIPAMAEVIEVFPSARLWLVGPEADADYGQKVREWIKDHRIQQSVVWVGALTGRDVVQAFVDADVFVLPSYTENFGMTVAEAMACGCPVVISDKVNIQSEVASAGAGIVTRCDSSEVGQAIVELLRNPAKRARFGQSGRSFVHDNWTWDSVSQDMQAQYQNVIDSFATTSPRVGSG